MSDTAETPELKRELRKAKLIWLFLAILLVPFPVPVSPPISISLQDDAGNPIPDIQISLDAEGSFRPQYSSEDKVTGESGTVEFSSRYRWNILVFRCFGLAWDLIPLHGVGSGESFVSSRVEIALRKGSSEHPTGWFFDPDLNGIVTAEDHGWHLGDSESDLFFSVWTESGFYRLLVEENMIEYEIMIHVPKPRWPTRREYVLRFRWNDTESLQDLYRQYLDEMSGSPAVGNDEVSTASQTVVGETP